MIYGANPHNSSRFRDYSLNDCHSFNIAIALLYGALLSCLQDPQLIDVKTI